jgi:hypothetical protein
VAPTWSGDENYLSSFVGLPGCRGNHKKKRKIIKLTKHINAKYGRTQLSFLLDLILSYRRKRKNN